MTPRLRNVHGGHRSYCISSRTPHPVPVSLFLNKGKSSALAHWAAVRSHELISGKAMPSTWHSVRIQHISATINCLHYYSLLRATESFPAKTDEAVLEDTSHPFAVWTLVPILHRSYFRPVTESKGKAGWGCGGDGLKDPKVCPALTLLYQQTDALWTFTLYWALYLSLGKLRKWKTMESFFLLKEFTN